MIPRLTIGIPTRNRPEMLRRAIDSALDQTVPVRIVINDSGQCTRSRLMCEDFASRSPVAGHDFEYIARDGGSLWKNWQHVAKQAKTEFFMWLQDDDVISPFLAERVVNAFDRYPNAQVYCSRLTFSYDGRLGCSFYGSWGPKLHLDVLRMRPSEFSGTLLPIVAYFDTWAQSPAKAFRVGDPFYLMLDTLPDGCDMYTERLDIAFMGMHGTAIADPNVAGLSVLHEKNESLLTTNEAWKQSVIFHKFLDMMVELIPNWHDEMFGYFNMPGIHKMLQSFYNDMSLNVELSENCKAISKMVGGVLRGIHGMPIIRDEEPATKIIENEFGRFQVPV